MKEKLNKELLKQFNLSLEEETERLLVKKILLKNNIRYCGSCKRYTQYKKRQWSDGFGTYESKVCKRCLEKETRARNIKEIRKRKRRKFFY